MLEFLFVPENVDPNLDNILFGEIFSDAGMFCKKSELGQTLPLRLTQRIFGRIHLSVILLDELVTGWFSINKEESDQGDKNEESIETWKSSEIRIVAKSLVPLFSLKMLDQKRTK